jgi:DNA-binding XRE family transcriptional regulator
MQPRLDGTLVKRYRDERGLSREKLARLADCSTRTIVRIEMEGADVRAGIVARIALALGVPVDAIFTKPPEEAAV